MTGITKSISIRCVCLCVSSVIFIHFVWNDIITRHLLWRHLIPLPILLFHLLILVNILHLLMAFS